MVEERSTPVRSNSRSGSRLLALGAMAVGLALLAAVPLQAGDLADVKARGKLVLVCFPNQDIPFVEVNLDVMREKNLKLAEMHDPSQYMGLDVDVMKGFAKSLGVRLELRPYTTDFGELIPALGRGEGDLIADSLTITQDRRKVVDFSEPYFEGGESIVVRASAPISSPADLVGKVCSAARGTSQLESMRELLKGVKYTEVDFPAQAYVEVSESRADCAVAETTIPVGKTLLPPDPPLKVAFVLRKYQYGVAVRKGSDLLAPLNAYLDGLKRSGELKRLADLYKVSTLGTIPPPSHP